MSSSSKVESLRQVISAEQIQKRVREIAHQISDDYQGETVQTLAVLENSFMFLADLVRALGEHLGDGAEGEERGHAALHHAWKGCALRRRVPALQKIGRLMPPSPRRSLRARPRRSNACRGCNSAAANWSRRRLTDT